MSTNYSPKIVTSGLVLYLDAGNSKSFVSGSSTWFDLSGNRNTGSLGNGPVYNSANGGNILFDGTNDYVDFFAPNLGTTTTVEVWCKIASTASKMIFGWLRYTLFCSSGHIGFNTYNSDVYGISSTQVTALGLVNNWAHYVFEMRSDVSYTNNKIYINGMPQTLGQQLATENSANRNFNSGFGRIAIARNELASFFMPMNCSSFKVYNRALSAEEVRQNYNATKKRFGL
jgi:hypothetical protein